jgi:hypothetical protein
MKSSSPPLRFIIEVGPITFHNYSPADERRAIARTKEDMDEAIRRYWQVGPRNKAVRTRVERGA